MAKIDEIYNAVDDFGLITSSEAAGLGMSNAELVQQARMGKLVHVARGVYRMPVWPYQPEYPYAIAVKAAGEGAFLYGESVIALLNLAPTDPTKIWIATLKRTRRNLGKGIKLIPADNEIPIRIEGIPCQSLTDAVIAASKTMGIERALRAASEARNKGYITEKDMNLLKEGLLDDKKA